jgi:hypothetical protein
MLSSPYPVQIATSQCGLYVCYIKAERGYFTVQSVYTVASSTRIFNSVVKTRYKISGMLFAFVTFSCFLKYNFIQMD